MKACNDQARQCTKSMQISPFARNFQVHLLLLLHSRYLLVLFCATTYIEGEEAKNREEVKKGRLNSKIFVCFSLFQVSDSPCSDMRKTEGPFSSAFLLTSFALCYGHKNDCRWLREKDVKVNSNKTNILTFCSAA